MISGSSRESIRLLNMFSFVVRPNVVLLVMLSESSRELIRLLDMIRFVVRPNVVLLNLFSVSFDVDRRKEEEHNHCRRGLGITLLIVLPE